MDYFGLQTRLTGKRGRGRRRRGRKGGGGGGGVEANPRYGFLYT